MRRVSYCNPEDGKVLVFLTNNFELPALVIAMLYKLRGRVELFFKWIKQNLQIKHFLGTSANAVKTQVWIAARMRLRLGRDHPQGTQTGDKPVPNAADFECKRV